MQGVNDKAIYLSAMVRGEGGADSMFQSSETLAAILHYY